MLQKTIKETSIFYKFSTYVYKIINEIYWKPLEYIVKITALHIPGSGNLFIAINKMLVDKDTRSYIRLNYIIVWIFDLDS